ncbi:hypothetical protein KCV87_03720 [Actinosynnema pretiosum subsp. pretiosum]|uniref:Uncharacterized protein n=1 Tax=Actinosynnema pretiosum subsp. pretiosum TaxID=103721 RepID=A0AA45L8J9_9PSEU|nr:hypothetical protein KCV87_03720 [Actinosynnema pretiosum subsp. pretiosum]
MINTLVPIPQELRLLDLLPDPVVSTSSLAAMLGITVEETAQHARDWVNQGVLVLTQPSWTELHPNITHPEFTSSRYRLAGRHRAQETDQAQALLRWAVQQEFPQELERLGRYLHRRTLAAGKLLGDLREVFVDGFEVGAKPLFDNALAAYKWLIVHRREVVAVQRTAALVGGYRQEVLDIGAALWSVTLLNERWSWRCATPIPTADRGHWPKRTVSWDGWRRARATRGPCCGTVFGRWKPTRRAGCRKPRWQAGLSGCRAPT